MNNQTFASFTLPITDSKVPTHLGRHVNARIKDDNDLTEEQKHTLLNYPVVYIHTWEDQNGWNCYVGESYDLTQRTDQHGAAANNPAGNSWRTSWTGAIQKRSRAISYFFSSRDMNKSLCLDLEHSLCELLRQQNHCIHLTTQATTAQKNYSNKHLRDELLTDIWKVLKTSFSRLECYDVAVQKAAGMTKSKNSALYRITDDLVCTSVTLQIDPNDPNSVDRNALEEQIRNVAPALLEWPVIYMHMWDGNNTYVGETDNLVTRTNQHLQSSSLTLNSKGDVVDETWQEKKDSWRATVIAGKAKMYVFGSPHFNKSMTLDIEHRLIHYTIFLNTSVNGRTNAQKLYDNCDQMYQKFKAIAAWLNSKDPKTFMTLEEVQKRSVFIASPLLDLTNEQKHARDSILSAVNNALQTKKKTLVVVHGGAGTGKTVLASSLFFHLNSIGHSCHFVVNHAELINLYAKMDNAHSLNSGTNLSSQITKAQNLLNNSGYSPEIVLVDEAHLLYTQGHKGGVHSAQLPLIIDKAQITVLMYDEEQVTDNDQFGNVDMDFEALCESCQSRVQLVQLELKTQMRMQCDPETAKWIKSLSVEGEVIEPLTHGTYHCEGNTHIFTEEADTKYQIAVVENPQELIKRIKQHKDDKETPSALLATYSWAFDKKVTVGSLSLDWNPTGRNSKKGKKDDQRDATIWTLSPNVNSVGSYHDIQGFDLKYAGVIISEAVQYKLPKGAQTAYITFDPIKRCGSGKSSGRMPTLISNEHYVLLSRATKGLYIYPMDEKLREALIASIKAAGHEQK